jgi:hypothetical protein
MFALLLLHPESDIPLLMSSRLFPYFFVLGGFRDKPRTGLYHILSSTAFFSFSFQYLGAGNKLVSVLSTALGLL